MDFAEHGDIVCVIYTLSYTNGEVFDTNVGKSPIKFELGSGFVFKGFEKAVEGMRIGDVKTITIRCKDAFGEKCKDLVKEIPFENIPAHVNQEVGQRVEITVSEAEKIMGTIIELGAKGVTIDANPKQAGSDLILNVKLLDIETQET